MMIYDDDSVGFVNFGCWLLLEKVYEFICSWVFNSFCWFFFVISTVWFLQKEEICGLGFMDLTGAATVFLGSVKKKIDSL